MSHTSTPWVSNLIIDGYYEIGPADLKLRIAVRTLGEEKEDEENAAFIVRAVNNFDDMLDKLKLLHDHSICPKDCDLAALIAKAEERA
jgi:hypothetical protein